MTYDLNYMENEILSMSGDELIEFTYRGLINFIEKAKKSAKENDVESRVEFTSKATSVILYLESILDFDKGKELAQRLSSLYGYAVKRLNEANLDNNVEIYNEVLSIFKELYSAWREGVILKKGKEEKDSIKKKGVIDSYKEKKQFYRDRNEEDHNREVERNFEIYG